MLRLLENEMSEIINNSKHRIATLKEIILKLHAGADPETVRQELTEIVEEVDATEIAAMENQLIEEGMAATEIQSMCDLHAQVLRDITNEPKEIKIDPGHPIDTFRLENFALGNLVEKIREIAEPLSGKSDEEAEKIRVSILTELNTLMDIEKHYSRKENLLFPFLEKHEITGPTQVMWGKDDEVREFLKGFAKSLKAAGTQNEITAAVAEQGEKALHQLTEMIYKEENILFPMSLDTLTDQEWSEIFHQSALIGWCLVEPRSGYKPSEQANPPVSAKIAGEQAIALGTGHLHLEQLKAIFAVLPVDLTFIDVDDKVAFFSHRPDAIFPRNTTVLGRKVQHCHPPKSVHMVEQILDDFKSGAQEHADFWINFRGVFAHIRYFAVREESGKYLGTLEVTQDVTAIRALKDERRLLQYD
jgi:DUF438 domain-containing protein